MAGVDPRFDVLNGQDPVAYILSSNVARRHMNAGQRSMAVVKAKSFNVERFYGKKEAGDRLAGELKVNPARVSQAVLILEHRPDLADDVIAGHLPLNDAYEKARARKEGKDTDEARMARLQEVALHFRRWRSRYDAPGHSQQRGDADAPKRRLLAVHLRSTRDAG
jgi:hypothetical protein